MKGGLKMKEDNRLGFAVFCLPENEGLTRQVLEEVKGVDIQPISQPVIRRKIVENVPVVQEGVYIDGLCPQKTGEITIPCLLMENNISAEITLWSRPNLSELKDKDA